MKHSEKAVGLVLWGGLAVGIWHAWGNYQERTNSREAIYERLRQKAIEAAQQGRDPINHPFEGLLNKDK